MPRTATSKSLLIFGVPGLLAGLLGLLIPAVQDFFMKQLDFHGAAGRSAFDLIAFCVGDLGLFHCLAAYQNNVLFAKASIVARLVACSVMLRHSHLSLLKLACGFEFTGLAATAACVLFERRDKRD